MSAPKPKLAVLFIDDERDNLMAMRRVFRSDFEVLIASSVIEGLALLHTRAVDVAVVDYSMPRDNGIAFIRNAGARVKCGSIVLTAYGDRIDVRNEAVAAGAEPFGKPWDPAMLRALIFKVAQQRHTPPGRAPTHTSL